MQDQAPTTFVSSTFFDLRQIRADIAELVEKQLGYRFLMSEHESFPVDPALDTIENCRRRVEQDADIFVLVIGSRYGTVPEGTGKSVTNLEYLMAKAKGIPIFAFVQRDLLALLPIWEANPAADFSRAVDTPKLFEFVKELRSSDRVWTFPFDSAQQITAVLRTQLAYEMRRGLRVSGQLRAVPETAGLTGKALGIALERAPGWPGNLLATLVQDEVVLARDIRRNHASGIAIGVGERVEEADVSSWIASLMGQALRLIDGIRILVNSLLNEAFQAADISALRYGADQIGGAYRDSIEWAARIRKSHVPEDWKPVLHEVSFMLDNVLAEIEGFPARLQGAIEAALKEQTEGPVEVNVTFNVSIKQTGYYEELERLKKKRRL